MIIDSVTTRSAHIPLTRPYTIASGTHHAVRIFLVRIEAAGLTGHGAASPAEDVTGETDAACEAALASPGVTDLVSQDAASVTRIALSLRNHLPHAPAAVAAVDMALHDLRAQALGVPLCVALGRVHDSLPTSVTIGIKDTAAALQEADEYLARGFKALKVKIGNDVAADTERLTMLRDHVGSGVAIRVDANTGYDVADTLRMLGVARRLGLELVEQPLPASALEETRSLPDRDLVCLDESVHDARDARRAAAPPAAGSFNIKLMKCGGVTEAMEIARIAHDAGVGLMWGCMDESRVSIAAALHAALASPATRYLDLDGHLDLSDDPFRGGFTLEDGMLRPTDRPGLGVSER